MKIWNEEIFGPVLSLMKFNDEDHAVQIANTTNYGLAAGVMSLDDSRCQRIASKLRAGVVWVNCSQSCFVELPWGGMRQSGSGHRELGPWGLDNFLEIKQVLKYTSPKPLGWYWTTKPETPKL